ncbi:hypothetical protein K8640_10305 [Myxococcus sp. XM-1-1-1]|jgi:cysteine synthase B|uniref:pyridoxal-phosphate dependent enzyme n=1 Tax=Myxococcus TaxID=32 RepID=UPI001CBF5C27|nr:MULTISPECIES: pyridoxal-phosphate dependent enzyme [Myxococcus]MBZ4408606.1 hypothetical protein [Myxococcus sp. XM-1-1-1]MCK8496553.1 hypothetical protein [Myxococcus fulvus]
MYFPLSRLSPEGPVVLWGGELPSGGLKYLTFSRYLETVPEGACGLVELSGSSSSLALDALGRERGLPVLALTDTAGAAYLRDQGFGGEVRTVRRLSEAWEVALGYERQGWCWPRQLSNGALVGCVEGWAGELRDFVRDAFPSVRRVVCGFGTGATLVGLHRAFTPQGYEVVGLQPAKGSSLPGWRRWQEQNLGKEDLFHPHREEVVLETAAPKHSDSLAALLTYARAETHPEEMLVIGHNARPPFG